MRVSQPKCVVLLSCQGVANSESVIGTLRLDKIEKTITHTCVFRFFLKESITRYAMKFSKQDQ